MSSYPFHGGSGGGTGEISETLETVFFVLIFTFLEANESTRVSHLGVSFPRPGRIACAGPGALGICGGGIAPPPRAVTRRHACKKIK